MRALAAAFALAFPLAAAADESDGRWYVQLDNDAFVTTDRWYTSGLRIGRVASEGDVETEWGVLQEIYTPEPKHFDLGTVDRVPAARLLLVHARHWRPANRWHTLQVAVGVRGPSALGRETTDAVHRLIDARTVEWSRQGRDRFDGHVAWTTTHAPSRYAVHYGAIAGSQLAFAHATVELRVGSGAREISSPVLRYVATPPVPRDGPRGWGGFVALGARAIARNELLDDGYDPMAPDPGFRRVVGRASAGIAWTNHCAGVSLAVAVDSREFARQRRAHGFGSLTFHWDF